MATKPRHRKSAIQLWVADNRKAGGYTSADLADWTGVTEATARGWESRGRPSEDAIAILERKFGKPAPDREEPGGQDLASAIAALAEELRAWREEREQTEVRLRVIEAELRSNRERPRLEAILERSVPDGTTG